MSFSASFEKLRIQPKQQQQQQHQGLALLYFILRQIEGRAGGERPSLQSPSPPPSRGGRLCICRPNIQHERRQRRRREGTEKASSGRQRGEFCLHRSGECPAGCDSRPNPSVHQGDSREGIPSTNTVDERGTSRWAGGDREGGI